MSSRDLATDIEVVPTSHDRELTLCRKIEEAGLEKQTKARKLLHLKSPISTDKLSFEPIEEGLVVKTTTNYPLPGEQTAEFKITPKNYKKELASSRMYVKHLPAWAPIWLGRLGASLVYYSFGIGHGFTTETVFLPPRTREEWIQKENYPAEIARHTIVDRLGAISLFPGRLDKVKVSAKYSGHANDIRVLKDIVQPQLV